MKLFEKKLWRPILVMAFIVGSIGSAWAVAPQVRIVGSSSVFPFSAEVVQNLFFIQHKDVPVIEKTGSGAGIKLFCGGDSLEFPAGVNSSRPMSGKERLVCKNHGVEDIIEVKLGFGGIILAVVPAVEQGPNALRSLTLHELYLALSKEVLIEGSWVPNPHTRWSQINPELPNRDILIFGPPATSGMRDALKEIIFDPECAGKRGGICGQFREDGCYVEMPENTKLIIQKLHTNLEGIGILGYPFLEENKDVLTALKIGGVAPSLKTISTGRYPLSRPLYFYVKTSLLSTNEILQNYVKSLVSELMWHDEGLLSEKGLIVPPLLSRKACRKKIASRINK